MEKQIEVNLTRNKSNGQYSLSIPSKKLKGWGLDMRDIKTVKLTPKAFR